MQKKQAMTIDEIHASTLEVLKKLVAICDAIGVDYSLAYGSLIGAVRHHGFIPWDDDMDVLLLRDEYEKLVSYCLDNAAALLPFKLLCRKNTKDYPYTIARFVDTRYETDHKFLKPYGCGAFIDLYPFDGIGEAKEQDRQKVIKKKIWNERLAMYASMKAFVKEPGDPVKTILRRIMYRYAKLRGKDVFLDRMERLKDLFPLSQSQYVACMVWEHTVTPIKKAYYKDFTTLDFAGVKVKVSSKYDEILRAIYGDYMKLPSLEDRHATHDYTMYRL